MLRVFQERRSLRGSAALYRFLLVDSPLQLPTSELPAPKNCSFETDIATHPRSQADKWPKFCKSKSRNKTSHQIVHDLLRRRIHQVGMNFAREEIIQSP